MSDSSPTEDLADLYENAPCGYVSLSPERNIVKINQTLVDWLARPKSELLGKSIHDILSFGGKIAFETHLAPLLRLQDHVYEIALDLINGRGDKVEVIANASERRNALGEQEFTRLTIFRATDRRIFERSLIEARIKAEEAAKAEHNAQRLRDQFIAVLGHDLRNPLAAIRAGIFVLQRSQKLDDRGKIVLDEMDASIGRANILIDDVLDFARGQLGQGLALDVEPDRPLQPVLEQVVVEMRAIAPDRKVVSKIALDHVVDCDPDRIAQLASNLLANAITHGDPCTPVKLTASTAPDIFALSVTNGGDPIPELTRDKLFEPFFRGGGGGSRNGLGLGLFIVTEIAKAHGGRMEVEFEPGETRFTFTMPRMRRSLSTEHSK